MPAAEGNKPLQPGQIKLSYIPHEWPLTPLGDRKNPYVEGWQDNPLTKTQIEAELAGGYCKGIGLMSGPVDNQHGLVWVDVDGASVYPVIEKESGLPLKEALPPTLTIMSGKPGRERKLYKLKLDDFQHFTRTVYKWYGDEANEKLEILWKRRQGVLMGAHPETEGYYTPEGEGFEWADKLPYLPQWIVDGVITKEARMGKPEVEHTRMVGSNWAINSSTSIERRIEEAKESMYALSELHPEAVDDYEMWVTVGMALHEIDESCLELWEEWSKQSSKYKEGACLQKWRSFHNDGSGVTLGSVIHHAKEAGWKGPSLDHLAMPVSDNEVERLINEAAKKLQEEPKMPDLLHEVFTPRGKKPVTAVRDTKGRNPTQKEIVDLINQMTKGTLRYCDSIASFVRFGGKCPGLWEPVPIEELQREICNHLDLLQLPQGWGYSTLTAVTDLARIRWGGFEPYNKTEDLLFRNGVLHVPTREFSYFSQPGIKERARDYCFTQMLPYDYNPAATGEPIFDFFMNCMQLDTTKAELLIAVCRAILLRRHECQRFFEIIGPGKTGKSTFATLCIALVGYKNASASTFQRLEENRFELINFVNKSLVYLADQDAWGGSCSTLKMMTGGDLLKGERKNKNESVDFTYQGMVLITANQPIQSIDKTSGLKRRRLPIEFSNIYKGDDTTPLITINRQTGETHGVFAKEIPGLINMCLDMSEERMRDLIVRTAETVPSLRNYIEAQEMAVNPIHAFLDHECVYDKDARCFAGRKMTDPDNPTRFLNSYLDLWPAYASYCQKVGIKETSKGRFIQTVKDNLYAVHELNGYIRDEQRRLRRPNVKGYEFDKNPPDTIFYGMALRTSSPKYMEEDYPSVIEFANKLKYQ